MSDRYCTVIQTRVTKIFSFAIMEENDKRVKSINWEEVKEKFESVPKFVIAGHELSFEIGDLDEHFIKKAKEELRETPEIVAQGIKELKELIAGNDKMKFFLN